MLSRASILGSGCSVHGAGLCHDRDTFAGRVAAWRDAFRFRDARIVGVLADNSPQWLACDLGIRAAGAVAVPLPPFFSDGQLRHVLDAGGVDLVAASPPDRILDLDIGFRVDGGMGDLSLLRRPPAADIAIPAGSAKITFTSGSTGEPKGVCLDDSACMRLAATLCELLHPLGIERHLSVLPYATLLENVAGAYAGLMAGAAVMAPSLAELGFGGDAGFDPERFLRCLHEYRPDSLILLPELLKGLVVMREFGARLPASLKFVAVGGGKVGAGLIERARAVGIPAFEGYGLSECASVVSLNLPDAQRPGSVGRPLPHVRVRLADDGEILVAGSVMRGYLGAGLPAQEVATGDIGEFDRDGFLYVRGRKKHQFVTSFGRNVNPEWPESLLLQSPVLRQAAVFGEGLPGNVAVLVPTPGMPDAAVAQAVRQTNSELPGYARIHAWLRATEPFSAANGLATANGRPRRAAIESVYGGRFGDALGEKACHASQP